MNLIKDGKFLYKYESYWRESINSKETDSAGKLFPYPKEGVYWSGKEVLVEKLKEVEIYLMDRAKFFRYEKNKYKACLLCHKKDVITGLFTMNNIRWENGLKHYIKKHNIKPSDEFVDSIFRFKTKGEKAGRIIAKINGVKVIKNDKKVLKVDRNQILIMDALMSHGGYKLYVDTKHKHIFRYSEHAGLLDFNNTGLDKIIISGKTNRVDEEDDDIFLPKNMVDAYDYEYIFHTHPPTPKPGSRAKLGILYEFPSISDIFHFMDHYNGGRTQGSIVITPEGMYIIRKKTQDDKKIIIDEDNFYKDVTKVMWAVQKEAIKKYTTMFNKETFYSKIAQDQEYIEKINNILEKYQLYIDYYPRIKDDKNNWIIDTIYLPVYVIETKNK